MNTVIHDFTAEVSDPDGHVYRARAVGRPRRTGMWEGWLEFRPRGGGGQLRRTAVETTQPNLDALRYWASGLEPVYLEGALERAIAGRRADSAPSSR
jgi:hypothetical protein